MQHCRVEIITQTDGRESRVVKSGTMCLTPVSLGICYEDNGAKVELSLKNGVVEICRTGDYSMFLTLKKGAVTDGTLGIGGQVGNIRTSTTRIAYSLRETSALLSLHYELIIGTEKQAMKLRIVAQYEDTGENTL